MSWRGSSLSELGTAVTQHSPPFAAQASRSSSERERRVGRRANAALWLKTTGTCESSMVSSAVREPACDRSIAMPMSFMRFTTSTPNSLKPQFVRSNWPSPIQLLRVYVRPARRMPMPYSTSTRCRSWSIDRCSTVGRNPIFARLPRLQDVLRAADFHHGLAALVDVGQHHSDFVHQIAEAAVRRVRLLAQAGQQVGRGYG